jgi:hypothetical protein
VAVGRIGCRAGSASFLRRGVDKCCVSTVSGFYLGPLAPWRICRDTSAVVLRRFDVRSRCPGLLVPCVSGGRKGALSCSDLPSLRHAVCGPIADCVGRDSLVFSSSFCPPVPLPSVLTQSWKCASHRCRPSAALSLMVGCGESGEDPVHPVMAAGCRAETFGWRGRAVRPLSWIRLRLGQMKRSQILFFTSHTSPHLSTVNAVSECSATWYQLRNPAAPDTGHW